MTSKTKVSIMLVIALLSAAIVVGGAGQMILYNSEQIAGFDDKYLTQAEANARFDALEDGQERIEDKLDRALEER